MDETSHEAATTGLHAGDKFRPSRMESVGSAVSGITLVEEHVNSSISHGESLSTQSRPPWPKRFFKSAMKRSLVAHRFRCKVISDTKMQLSLAPNMKHHSQISPWIVHVFVLPGQTMTGDGMPQRAQCMIDTGNHQGNIISKDFVLSTLKLPENKLLELTADEKRGGISATGHNLLPSGAIHLDWYYETSPHVFRNMRFLVSPNPSYDLVIGAQSIEKHNILSMPNLTITPPDCPIPYTDNLPKNVEMALALLSSKTDQVLSHHRNSARVSSEENNGDMNCDTNFTDTSSNPALDFSPKSIPGPSADITSGSLTSDIRGIFSSPIQKIEPRKPKALAQLPVNMSAIPVAKECSAVSSDDDLRSSQRISLSESKTKDRRERGTSGGFDNSEQKTAIEEATALITQQLSAFAITALQKTIESTFIQSPCDNQKSSPGCSSGANGSSSKGGRNGNQQERKKRRKMTEDGDYEKGDNGGDEGEDDGEPDNGKRCGHIDESPREWGCIFYAQHPDRYHFKIDKKFKSCSTKPFRRLDELLKHILHVHGFPELLCPTCNLVFLQEKHYEHSLVCDVRGTALIKLGIDLSVREKLTNLPRKSRNISSEERWNQLVDIIFPGERPPPLDFEEGAKRVEEFKMYLQENLGTLAEKHAPRAIEKLRLNDQIMCLVQIALKEIFEHLSNDVIEEAFEGFRAHEHEVSTRNSGNVTGTILSSSNASPKTLSKGKAPELPDLQLPIASTSFSSRHNRSADQEESDFDRPGRHSRNASDHLSKFAVHYRIPNHSNSQNTMNTSHPPAFSEPISSNSSGVNINCPSARVLTPSSPETNAHQLFNSSSDNEVLHENLFASDESVLLEPMLGDLDFDKFWRGEDFLYALDRDGNSGEDP